MLSMRSAFYSAFFTIATAPLFAQGSDTCATAQVISGSGVFAFDNTAATTDGLGDPLCLNAGQNQINNDVWFSWVAPSTGGFTFNTCGQTTIDSRLAIYDTSCAGLILACDDDACVVGLQSTFDYIVTSGNTYLVRVGIYPGATNGTGTFSITPVGQLAVLDTQVNPNNGRTYHLLQAGTWTSAEATAIALGGHLTTVNDATENAWIVSTWQFYQATAHDLWIGFNDAALEGSFVWADGTPVGYTNWDAGEPNNGLTGEDYTNIRRDSLTGNWNDLGNNPTGFFNAVFGVVEIPGTPAVSFCSGDAVGTTCLACGNNGGAGRGCANSSFPNGAMLATSGNASVSGDTLALNGTDLTGPGLFFQANGTSASPITFGDGMLCASAGILRLGVVFPTAGAATYPGGLTPNPITVGGGPITAGNIKHYQCWYRDAITFCSSATYNLTQGLSVTWGS
ncbi:MAG: C-type lectin domain-containing protein [Planctomycetota bacterium]|nr:C-type lectin domain-containing protein [Planctomycetota bacterium]